METEHSLPAPALFTLVRDCGKNQPVADGGGRGRGRGGDPAALNQIVLVQMALPSRASPAGRGGLGAAPGRGQLRPAPPPAPPSSPSPPSSRRGWARARPPGLGPLLGAHCTGAGGRWAGMAAAISPARGLARHRALPTEGPASPAPSLRSRGQLCVSGVSPPRLLQKSQVSAGCPRPRPASPARLPGPLPGSPGSCRVSLPFQNPTGVYGRLWSPMQDFLLPALSSSSCTCLVLVKQP